MPNPIRPPGQENDPAMLEQQLANRMAGQYRSEGRDILSDYLRFAITKAPWVVDPIGMGANTAIEAQRTSGVMEAPVVPVKSLGVMLARALERFAPGHYSILSKSPATTIIRGMEPEEASKYKDIYAMVEPFNDSRLGTTVSVPEKAALFEMRAQRPDMQWKPAVGNRMIVNPSAVPLVEQGTPLGAHILIHEGNHALGPAVRAMSRDLKPHQVSDLQWAGTMPENVDQVAEAVKQFPSLPWMYADYRRSGTSPQGSLAELLAEAQARVESRNRFPKIPESVYHSRAERRGSAFQAGDPTVPTMPKNLLVPMQEFQNEDFLTRALRSFWGNQNK